ncbi:MAG: ribonuclease J [Solobacterium sp.]|nr:ribonuclease J [Solobacterium sp.]
MSKVRIFALGGLDEDGKNMYVVEIGDEIFVMECGLKYPGDQLGIEMIIPDFTYLKQHQDRIKGIFITHGHDDVMAALPSLLKEMPDVPIYMAPLTALMFERKIKKLGMKDVRIHRVRRNSMIKIGKTEIRTFGTTQSIADGFGIAIRTPDGYVVYTGEFIVDYDTRTDAFKFEIISLTDLGNTGVLALLTESVGSFRAGHSAPQHRITPMIEQYFEDSRGRMFITVFNQNIYRIIEIIELANKYNRKVMIYDEELRNLMHDMATLGYYHIPAGLEIPVTSFSNDMENILVIVAGTGSSIFKKIHKIATKEDDRIELRPSDTIIIASPAVPGTERQESAMEDDLYKEGARVCMVDAKRTFSMHASVEDLKMMLYLLKPKYYIPVKGEYRQLIANANIALNMGFRADHIIVLDNGQIVQFVDGKLQKNYEFIDVDDVLVNGNENLDASGMVLRDREILSTEGAIIVGVVMNHTTKEIIGGPDVQSRGVIYLKDADYILKEIGVIMESTINEAVAAGKYDNLACRSEAREKIGKYVLRETGKRPMILPAIIEINTKD